MRLAAAALAVAVTACTADHRTPPAPAATAASATPPALTATASVVAAPPPAPPPKPWLERTLLAEDPRWADWMAHAEELKLQILVTEVGADDAAWKSHGFRVDAEYVYPASAIKTFLAVAALRVLNRRLGAPLPLSTRIRRCRFRKPGCKPPRVDEDPDHEPDPGEDPKHRKLFVGQEIAKMLSYSDNDSYNRLFDIVGHAALTPELRGLGFDSVRMHHRMNAPAKRSRTTRRVVLLPPGKKAIDIPIRKSKLELEATVAAGMKIGKAHNAPGGLVEEPLDFGTKNYASLRDLQRLTLSLHRPDHPQAAKLALSKKQRARILRSMTAHLRPGKPKNDHAPLSPGLLEVLPTKSIRYVSKAGRAYGFQLENAYVENTVTHQAMLVTAVVYANPNGVLNDDDYGYDDTTRPLLASLGKALGKALLGGTDGEK